MFDRTILLPNGRGPCSRHRFPRTLGGMRISPGWTATRSAAEFEASLDRLCERDEGPGEDEDEACYAPLTAEELAEIREAAADELLAAKAASTGRRGPGQPGPGKGFP